jgi:hypothetical protein
MKKISYTVEEEGAPGDELMETIARFEFSLGTLGTSYWKSTNIYMNQ